MAEPLDIDGLYHVSLIKAVAGDFAGAVETARQILDAVPTHLLGLAALAEAALGAGDSATAKEAYGTFLDNLATERARQLQEYQDHAPIIETYEQDAHNLLGR
jgi:predicted TPR repeat methyltransferase